MTVDTDRCAHCLAVFPIPSGIGDEHARWCSQECRAADLNEASSLPRGSVRLAQGQGFALIDPLCW